MERTTPLYACHVALGGKMVPFAGYLLPVQYGAGVIAEHKAVREGVGLFDVSHMGEAMLEGPDALANLNRLLTNDFTDMADGQARYSPMCNEAGGVVDDLLVYRFSQEKYLLVLNASNREKDVAWMAARLSGDARLADVSDSIAQLALQGPMAQAVIRAMAPDIALPPRSYTFVPEVMLAGVRCLLARTGYTGEQGFELYCAPGDAQALWQALLAAGAPFGILPCGLGARDTLRLEAGMVLYGHEMDDTVSPLETGLAPFVKMEKDDFIGKQALVARGAPTVARVGLRIVDRGIARGAEAVYAGDVCVGHTTSGTHCPFIGYAAAMALVDTAHAQVGTRLAVEVRGKRLAAEVVKLPFYARKRKAAR